jgi:hypothetical protein
MTIIGCDYLPGFQQIACIDTETGELTNTRAPGGTADLQRARSTRCERASGVGNEWARRGATQRRVCSSIAKRIPLNYSLQNLAQPRLHPAGTARTNPSRTFAFPAGKLQYTVLGQAARRGPRPNFSLLQTILEIDP